MVIVSVVITPRGSSNATRNSGLNIDDRIFSPQMAAPKMNQVPSTPSAAIQAGIPILVVSPRTCLSITGPIASALVG